MQVFIVNGQQIEVEDEDDLKIILQDLALTDMWMKEVHNQLIGDDKCKESRNK